LSIILLLVIKNSFVFSNSFFSVRDKLFLIEKKEDNRITIAIVNAVIKTLIPKYKLAILITKNDIPHKRTIILTIKQNRDTLILNFFVSRNPISSINLTFHNTSSPDFKNLNCLLLSSNGIELFML
jgi:hypothetical protein